MTYIPDSLRRQVEARADRCCEYCLLPNHLSFYSHEVDHVIALKHRGMTTADKMPW
ncbi:MAG: HNH endonuclease [Coleofasciculaceae cyanobacterium SM2_3_26]|nr:HNH endonuclease [Coleofasciculaceae cyanobacterium SM2_3_26]